MAKQYHSVFTEPLVLEESYICSEDVDSTIDEVQFGENEMEWAINKMRTYASSGPDDIPPILLKRCAGSLKKPLSILWRQSLRTGLIPDICKLGLITPLFKGVLEVNLETTDL